MQTSDSNSEPDFNWESDPSHPGGVDPSPYNYQCSGTRVYQRKSAAALIEQFVSDQYMLLEAARSKLPFIHKKCLPSLKLSRGLVIVGALSGQGKSTTCVNILLGFLENSDKRVVVISNEETTASIYLRAACARLLLPYPAYLDGAFGPSQIAKIEEEVQKIMQRVEIVEDQKFRMTVLEDVISVLKYAEQDDSVGLVLIDYLQTVVESREDKSAEPFVVSKKFGYYLKEYGRRAKVPVIAFAQLKPKSEAAEMQSRIQNDKTIYNHAFTVIEVIPDFDTKLTTFKLHKNRLGTDQTEESVMKFNNGRYDAEW